MKWEEVSTIYPDQFVKLKILESHMVGNIKFIDDMAIIKGIKDNKEATKELLQSTGGFIVYHTNNEEIKVKVRKVRGYRGI